jgi:CRP-like cAMP-binding protein
MATLQTHDTDIDVLREVPFFAGLSEEHLKLITFSAESRSLPEKLLVFDQGQLLHSAYVVMSGSLKAERKSAHSGKLERRSIGPGTILGERALIVDARATESVRVEERARVLQIRKLMFRKLMQENPRIAITLRSRLARAVLEMSAGFDAVGARLRQPPGA